MYVMYPLSYSCWAICIVRATLNPSLRLASCCSVEVVKGGAGVRLAGLVSMVCTLKAQPTRLCMKACASSLVS